MKSSITYILVFFFISFTNASCRRYYKLQQGEIKYIPYKGNELLIFQSDKDRLDTIYLKGMNDSNKIDDPLEIYSNKYEAIELKCTRTDPNYDRYLEDKKLVKLVAAQNGDNRIYFDICLKGSWFYDIDSYSLSFIKNMPNTELRIGDMIYKDVKVFEASNYAKQFEHRENYANRFYWSVSKGFLGLDRRDEKWRLIKVIEP